MSFLKTSYSFESLVTNISDGMMLMDFFKLNS